MASIKTAYDATSTSTSVTVTLTSLANGSARECTAIDNSTNLYMDYLVRIKTKGQTSGTATLDVYAYGALETTSPVYTDAATGTDAAFTAANVLNARLLGNVVMNAATSVTAGPFSISRAFDGNVPVKWGLIFVNSSGAALSATAGDHLIVVQGVYATSV